MMTGDITFYTFLQEMEMVEKPKKAPEQTAMVKMGMLGTLTIFTAVISITFTIVYTGK